MRPCQPDKNRKALLTQNKRFTKIYSIDMCRKPQGEIKVEIVKSTDVEQLKNLYKEAGWWSEGDDTDPDLIRKIIDGSFCFAVASIKDKIIGMGRAISDGVCDSYIQDVVVLNEFRGRRIGVLIMDELVKY